jgi:hypothetical protein
MAAFEHSIDVGLPAAEAAREWASFPFRSLVGFFRTPGQRLHWRDDAGSEAWGVTLLVGLGRSRTRIHVTIDYFPAPAAVSAATLDAHVSADLTMFRRFIESDAARAAAHERDARSG